LTIPNSRLDYLQNREDLKRARKVLVEEDLQECEEAREKVHEMTIPQTQEFLVQAWWEYLDLWKWRIPEEGHLRVRYQVGPENVPSSQGLAPQVC